MHRPPLCLSVLAAATLTVSCKRAETPSEQLDQVQVRATAVAQAMKDYTFAQKDEFTATLASQLASIHQDLDLLAAKIEPSSEAVKAEAKPRLESLRAQTARLTTQLDEVRNATASTWDNVKTGAKQAFTEMQEGINQARQWASEKLAP